MPDARAPLTRRSGLRLEADAHSGRSGLDSGTGLSGGRGRLRCSSGIQEFDLIVQDLSIASNAGDKFHHLGKDLIGVTPIAADANDSQRSQLPKVLIFDLGDGYIEFVSNLCSDRFQHPSLALKGLIFGKAKSHP